MPQTFTDQELEALKVIVEYAAERCGGGEDIIGAVLYTGAYTKLDRNAHAIVSLVDKIENKQKEIT